MNPFTPTILMLRAVLAAKRLALPMLLAVLSVFMAVPVLAPGCSWLSEPGSPQAAALDCTKTSLAGKVGPIVGTVADLARKGGDGFEGALTELGLKVGADVLGCAVQAAMGELHKLASGSRDIAAAEAHKRLGDYAAKRRFIYVGGSL